MVTVPKIPPGFESATFFPPGGRNLLLLFLFVLQRISALNSVRLWLIRALPSSWKWLFLVISPPPPPPLPAPSLLFRPLSFFNSLYELDLAGCCFSPWKPTQHSESAKLRLNKQRPNKIHHPSIAPSLPPPLHRSSRLPYCTATRRDLGSDGGLNTHVIVHMRSRRRKTLLHNRRPHLHQRNDVAQMDVVSGNVPPRRRALTM